MRNLKLAEVSIKKNESRELVAFSKNWMCSVGGLGTTTQFGPTSSKWNQNNSISRSFSFIQLLSDAFVIS